MKEVVHGLYMTEGLRGANAYLLHSSSGDVLVDCGLAHDIGKILPQIAQLGFTPSVNSIVLTHFHGDHVGGAAELSKQWGAQVLSHIDDAPYIEEPASIPAFSSSRHFINWLGANVIFRYAACKVERRLVDGDYIDALDRCMVIHTPGHTRGNICLYQPERQILLCGDAIFNQNPINRRPGMGIFARPIAQDISQAILSIQKLSELPIKVLCFGHGEPILDQAEDQIKTFLMKIKS